MHGMCRLLLVASLAVSVGAYNLRILHVNDHHSHVESDNYDANTDTQELLGCDMVKQVKFKYGGYSRVNQLLANLEKGTSDIAAPATAGNVLKLHAGDALTGTLWYTLFKGVADAEVMGKACFHAMGLGNHEFDDGDQNLAYFITNLTETSKNCPGGSTKVVAANVVPGASSPLKNLLIKSTTFTIGGERVGVIGIDIKAKTEQSSSPSHGTTLSAEREAAQSEIDSLTAAGVNKIVIVSHVGLTMDTTLAAELTGVDVIVGGDSHTLLGDSAKFAVGPGGNAIATYPKEVTNSGKKVCIVQAWEYAHVVGMLDVVFDSAGDVTSCTGAPVVPIAELSSWNDEDGLALSDEQKAKLQTAIKGSTALPHSVVTAEHAATKAYLTASSAKVEEMKKSKITSIAAKHCFERIPGQGRSKICATCDSYVKGGAACDLVAYAFLMQEKSADIAIQNGGGCREDIKKGDYTIADAYSMLPFSNTLFVLDMTGAQIKSVLEDALDNALVGGSSGAYPYASGLTYEVDAAKAKGSRVSMLKVNSRRAETYTDIVDDTTYKVITNNYIAGGKDGYTTFSSINVKVDTYTEYAQGFINYLKTQSSIPAWDETHSSTQKFTNSSGVEHTTANCPSHLATAPSSRRAAHLDMSKCPAGNYSHQVKMTLKLAYNKEQFDSSKQAAVTKSVAKVAEVPKSQVSIANITEVADVRRAAHGGKSVQFDVLVKANAKAAADTIAGKLTLDNLKTAFTENDLSAPTIVSAASVETLTTASDGPVLDNFSVPSLPHMGTVLLGTLLALVAASF
eukprot:Tamp_06841.p1 GENE.Tamp_06841~~Tamp_06841.p1  ORF type:complete len:794 (-),score=198.51 Tamp_06841:213-2594(-)